LQGYLKYVKAKYKEFCDNFVYKIYLTDIARFYVLRNGTEIDRYYDILNGTIKEQPKPEEVKAKIFEEFDRLRGEEDAN